MLGPGPVGPGELLTNTAGKQTTRDIGYVEEVTLAHVVNSRCFNTLVCPSKRTSESCLERFSVSNVVAILAQPVVSRQG